MGERRGWKFLGINVGAPKVPAGTFKPTNPAAANPATQGAIDLGANQVNQNIAAGNKRSLEGMGLVGGLGTIGALGAAGGAGGTGAAAGGSGLGAIAGDVGGAIASGAKDLGSYLTGNGGANALGLAGIAEAALRDKQAMDYAKGALSSEQDLFNQKAPLRALGIAGMQNVRGNPFATTNANMSTGPTGPAAGGTPGTIAGQIGNAISKVSTPGGTNPMMGALAGNQASAPFIPRNPTQPVGPAGPTDIASGNLPPLRIMGMQ